MAQDRAQAKPEAAAVARRRAVCFLAGMAGTPLLGSGMRSFGLWVMYCAADLAAPASRL